MSKINFSNEEKVVLVNKVKTYFASELDLDIGQFDAEFLIDFFSEELGSFYYNRGLLDARAVLQAKFDDIDAGIDELEKPTRFQ